MPRTDIRSKITTKIIDGLKAGKRPWVRPWSSDPNCGPPKNVISKQPYRGINPLVLSLASEDRHFQSRWWGTYRQWQSLGGQVQSRPKGVRPGEWGTTIVFYKPVTKQTVNDEGEPEKQSFRVLKSFTVFNAEQVDGPFDHLRPSTEDDNSTQPDFRQADEAIDATGAEIRFGGNQAFYKRPVGEWPHHTDGDFIQSPHRWQFPDLTDFYSTLFHEAVHWSEVRLGWNGSYALGELIAEIGSCFLAAECSIPNSDDLENHNQYLASWLKELNNDNNAIFKAAAQASKAADFILKFSMQADEKPLPVVTL